MKLPIKSSLPMYTCQLPSTDQIVEYRPYVMKEENVLMIANESGDPDQIALAIKNLLTSCTYNKLDVSQLPTFDLEYLYLMISAKSRGEEIKLNMRCNNKLADGTECGHSNAVLFNLISDVKIKRNEEHDKKVMLTENSGLILSYPNISSFLNTEEVETTSQKYNLLIKTIVDNIDTIFDGETECNARDYPQEEVREYIESLTEQQFAKVRKFFDTMPQVIGEVSFTCKKCKYKHRGIEISGLKDFLA